LDRTGRESQVATADSTTDKARSAAPSVGSDGTSTVLLEAGSKLVKPRKRLTPEQKYQIFLETQRGDISTATVLRKWGIHSSDLTRIRAQVCQGALESLARGNRSGRSRQEPPEMTALKADKVRVEEALKELAIENTLLRKKVN
jgi:transposase-like protein